MESKILKDPKTLYRTEGYDEPEQSGPALQSKMKIKPDCGEESYKGQGRLKGRHALITGGDSGIGRAAAIAYAREGADVAIQFMPGEEADAEEVRSLIEDAGQKALLLSYDLREVGAGETIVQKTIEQFGALDILVLNAAQQFAQKSLDDLSNEQVRETFQVNIISMFESVKAAEKYLEPGSAIITTSSSQADNPSPKLLDYAATNAAVSNFTVGLAGYFGEKGVRVNCVSPGPVWTPLQLDGGQLPGGTKSFGQHTFLGRAGQPVELSELYVYLASDASSFVTSAIMEISGGRSVL